MGVLKSMEIHIQNCQLYACIPLEWYLLSSQAKIIACKEGIVRLTENLLFQIQVSE